jgi:hypothetical protein
LGDKKWQVGLSEQKSIVLSEENSILWQDLIKISSSPGGKHPKAIVTIHPKTGEVISGQGIILEEFQQQYLRMAFNVMSRNVDDHSKNFAFCMTSDGKWRLSPAYDVAFSVDLATPKYANRHSLTINGKNENITRSELAIF